MAGDTHFSGYVGNRTTLAALDQASSSLHSQWRITVWHTAGPFAVDGQFRNFHPAAKDQPVHFNPASATSNTHNT